jgi:CSLREA domain-containing protein
MAVTGGPGVNRRWIPVAVAAVAVAAALTSCEVTGPYTTFLVNTTVDGGDAAPDGVCEMTVGLGDCSLRAAIDEANLVVDLSPRVVVPSGTYLLTVAGVDDDNAGGDLDVAPASGRLLIEADAPGAVIDGAGATSAIDHHGGLLAARRLALTGTSVAAVNSRPSSVTDLEEVSIHHNAGAGIAIAAGGTVAARNATITTNDGVGVSGGGRFTAAYVTVTANRGGGLAGSVRAWLTASIVADQDGGSDCGGAVTSLDHNLDSDGTCGLGEPGDLPGADPDLGLLTAGTLPGHQPQPGSPAVDAIPTGTASLCDGTSGGDQHGMAHPTRGGCDPGALELPEGDLPIPMGGSRNFLGTGVVGNASMPPDGQENLYLSINGYCTDRIQGDRFASRYLTATCSGAENPDYRSTNHEFYVELPDERTYATDVILFDATHRSNSSTDCFTPGELYDRACDFNPGSQSQPEMSTTYTLLDVDGTVLDDTDNPTMVESNGCSSTGTGHRGTATFSPDNTGTTDNGYTFNPAGVTSSTNWWLLCTIPASAPGGRYLLRVQNQDGLAGIDATQGSNNFGLAATPQNPKRLCDGRADPTCPRVYARDRISVRELGSGAFFLAELEFRDAGRTVRAELFDVAEGATQLRILGPSGPNSWSPTTFDWSATNGQSGVGVTAIALAPLQFNSHLLTIEWTLPADYDPPVDNAWWRLEVTAGAFVTDRSTWSVEVLDP